MKIIEMGTNYQIYGEDLIVLEKLPVQTYRVGFNKMTGFFLEKQHDMEIKEDKIYGVHEKKVDKVLKRFADAKKNLGVILSGDKGIGKSLFARLLAQKALKNNIPVILVDDFIPGLDNFLNDIKNEVMVLFDEFDKTFAKNKDEDPQSKMLSLFDGTSDGKKLFVVTCNKYSSLNEFMINRPGRFHFHFRFDYPNPEEVKEYLNDKLDEKYHSEISKVVVFSRKRKLNYDCLAAIAVELNEGEAFEEAIKDLNIVNTDYNSNNSFNVRLLTEEGIVFTAENETISLFGDSEVEHWVYDSKNNYITLSFKGNAALYDPKTATFVIPDGAFKVIFEDGDIQKDDLEAYKKLNFTSAQLIPNKAQGIHYSLT